MKQSTFAARFDILICADGALTVPLKSGAVASGREMILPIRDVAELEVPKCVINACVIQTARESRRRQEIEDKLPSNFS